MKFAKFLEEFIQEDALTDVSDLGLYFDPKGLIGFFKVNEDVEDGLERGDIDAILPNIISAATYKHNETEECFEMDSIHAVKGYGPMLYVALMQLSEGKGLCPSTHHGQVSKEARKVWYAFFEPEKYKVSKPLAKPLDALTTDYHDFEPLNYKYINLATLDLNQATQNTSKVVGDDTYDEKQQVLSEAIESFVTNKMRAMEREDQI